MITIEKPKLPYLILEGINERKESREERCLHVICPENKNTVKMGRGHQCEIRLQDISVSRMHSEIKFESGDFYVVDLNSKFGTLVRVDKAMELSSRVRLQIGRSLYKFQVEWSIYLAVNIISAPFCISAQSLVPSLNFVSLAVPRHSVLNRYCASVMHHWTFPLIFGCLFTDLGTALLLVLQYPLEQRGCPRTSCEGERKQRQDRTWVGLVQLIEAGRA